METLKTYTHRQVFLQSLLHLSPCPQSSRVSVSSISGGYSTSSLTNSSQSPSPSSFWITALHTLRSHTSSCSHTKRKASDCERRSSKVLETHSRYPRYQR